MKDIDRRRFVQRLGLLFTAAGSASCGGGTSAVAVEATPAPEPPQTTSPPALPPARASGGDLPPAPAPAASGEMRFTLTSATAGERVPFCLGFAFRMGDVASDQGLSGSLPTMQVTVKNRWPDGSLKFALVAGHASLSANTPLSVSLNTGSAAGGRLLTTADLKATGVTAEVGCGSFGAAQWSQADWDAPFIEWASGAEMSSWIYRKPVGSDAHLTAWLEVRLFASGAVEVLPWIENGYLTVAGPTTKNATYTFALGGTSRFSQAINLPHHCRTPLVSGTAVSHWLGADPIVTPKHDATYMMVTGVVPAYSAIVSPTAAAVAALPTSFSPLQLGNWSPGMGTGGYHDSIGLLPQWDVLYLTTTAAAAYKSVIFNGYSAGRYGIHYRDEVTQQPPRISSHPDLCINQSSVSSIYSSGASVTGAYTPLPSGTVPPMWTYTHHPSTGFMAYLVTGRFYFMEQVQFAATTNYLRNHSGYRQGSKGIFDSRIEHTRGVAWEMRTLAQAACVTPDGSPMRAEFLNCLKENIAYYHAMYVAQPNNAMGFTQPGGDYTPGDGVWFEATWMQDFLTAAIGYAKALQLEFDATSQGKLDAFFAWKAQSVVGRLGGAGSTEFLYRDAAPYTIAIAPSDSADFATGKGPWYKDWGQVYAATFGGSSSSVSGDPPYAPNCARVEGGELVGGYFGDSTTGGGYWANLQPALAYAVKHGVAGAAAAYARLTTAPNWAQQLSVFNAAPVWSVVPGPASALAPTSLPAWNAGQAVNEWREIPNSAMSGTPPSVDAGGYVGPVAKLGAWNGLAIDTRTNTVWSLGNGGHADYFGNEVMKFDLGGSAPAWVEVFASSPGSAVTSTSVRYSDGRPASVHSYYCHQFIERHNRALRVGATAVAKDAHSFWDVDGWDCAAAAGVNGWDPQYTYDRINSSTGNAMTNSWAVCKNPATEQIYVFVDNGPCRRMTPSSGVGGTWAQVGGSPPAGFTGNSAATAYDTKRDRILVAKGGVGYPFVGSTRWFTMTSTGTYAEHTLTGGAPLSELNAAATSVGMVYVPTLDAYLIRLGGAGGKVYKIDANTFAVSALATSGGAGLPGTFNVDVTQYENVYNRWLFAPSLRGIVYFPHYNANAWFLRLY